MPSHGDRTPNGVDLSRPTESTRRHLYELVVHVYFHPTPEEVEKAQSDPGNHWVPDYGPDEARLHVFYAYGRWFASWEALEEKKGAAADPSLPEWRRWSVVRIVEDADPSSATGVTFLEV
ncbi:MAG TPA: hypothetical protein VEL74_15255 [Thermoanaerobaculia bacterium]|nr:hypothetical protein [Thermoanaerobaculia bacterium]